MCVWVRELQFKRCWHFLVGRSGYVTHLKLTGSVFVCVCVCMRWELIMQAYHGYSFRSIPSPHHPSLTHTHTHTETVASFPCAVLICELVPVHFA